jgi:hypothetical protein
VYSSDRNPQRNLVSDAEFGLIVQKLEEAR